MRNPFTDTKNAFKFERKFFQGLIRLLQLHITILLVYCYYKEEQGTLYLIFRKH